MRSEWKQMPLGEVLELKRGYDLPSRDRNDGPYPIVSSSGVSGSHAEAKVQPPGVVTGRYGTIGNVYFVNEPFWPLNTSLYVRDFKGNDPRFIYYLLQTLNFDQYQDKAAVPGVNRNHLHEQVVSIPSLDEQRRIAHILGTFDDKIELNRQMNQTLEEMARAHFKSWFVDFDPVRAKMEGREPAGMDAETAALFPDRLVDSELGPIPEGWEVRPLDKLIDVNPRRNLERGAVAPYVDMSSTPVKGHYPDSRYDREFTGSGTKFINGDTLMAKITPCLENGKTMYVDFLPDDTTVAWGSTEFLVLRPKPPYPPEFAYYMARSDELRAQAIGLMTGSSGRQRVPVTAFKALQVVVPSAEVAGAFGMLVREWMKTIRVNNEQSSGLGEMREQSLGVLLHRPRSKVRRFIDG